MKRGELVRVLLVVILLGAAVFINMNGITGQAVYQPVADSSGQTIATQVFDEPGYDTHFTKTSIEGNHFVVQFYHDATYAMPVWVEGAAHTLSTANAEPLEEVTLLVPLVRGNIPRFDLHVGAESEIFEFGTLEEQLAQNEEYLGQFDNGLTEPVEEEISELVEETPVEISEPEAPIEVPEVIETTETSAPAETPSEPLPSFGTQSFGPTALLSACGTVTENSNLTQDLLSNDTCLTVTADNVILDCMGFSITYNIDGGDTETGITASSVENLIVRNCIIEDGNNSGANGHGIDLNTVDGTTLANNTIRTNGTASDAINFNNVDNAIVQNNTLFTGGFGGSNDGLECDTGCSNVTISRNTISTSGATSNNNGVFLDDSDAVIIERNIIFTNGSNTNRGVRVETTSVNITIRYNNITTNGTTGTNQGIFLDRTDNNTVTNNLINTSGSSNNFGILLDRTSSFNLIDNNTINTIGSSSHGIEIEPSIIDFSEQNNVTRNTINASGDGIVIDGNDNRSLIEANRITARSGTGIDIDDARTNFSIVQHNYVNASTGIVTESDHGLIFNNTVFATNSQGIRQIGYLSNISNNTITMNGTNSLTGLQFFENGATNNTAQYNTITITATSSGSEAIELRQEANHNLIQYNTVTVQGGISTTAVSLVIGANGNNFSDNVFRVRGSAAGIFGISLSGSGIGSEVANNTFHNTIFNDTQNWIDIGSSFVSNNSFFNTTFLTPNGSVRVPGLINASAGFSDITRTNLNITFNSVFVNSTEIPELNQSAIITLNNLPHDRADSIFDPDDDGIFTPCPSSICSDVSYNGSTFIYNVTNFTTYSSQEQLPFNVNRSYNLTQNIYANGTAVIINTSDVIFDCQGFTIRSNGSGIGIQSSGKENTTVRNCFITNFSNNINFVDTNQSVINNNTLTNSTSASMFIQTGFNNTLSQNSFVSFAGLGLDMTGGQGNTILENNISSNTTTGGSIDTNANSNLIANNTFFSNTGSALGLTNVANNTFLSNNVTCVSGTGVIYSRPGSNTLTNTLIRCTQGTGVLGVSTPAAAHGIFENTVIFTNGTGIRFGLSAINFTFINTTIQANTTAIGRLGTAILPHQFNTTTIHTNNTWIDLNGSNFTNTTFVNSFGHIRVFGLFTSNFTLNYTGLNVSLNRTFINSTLHTELNQSAQIRIATTAFTTPEARVDFDDDGTFVSCPGSVCTPAVFANGNVTFNVTRFTSYATGNQTTTCINITSNTNLAGNITVEGSCFAFQASDAILDCQGNMIIGNGSGTGVDMQNQTNITTQNCILSNFTYGIFASRANLSFILNNTVNETQLEGIEMLDAQRNIVANNTAITRMDGGSVAINMTRVLHLQILQNNGTGANNSGISVDGTNINNTLIGNFGSSTGFSGIGVSTSTNLTMINNTGNGTFGIQVVSTSGSTVINNTGIGGSNAFRLISSSNNILIGNNGTGTTTGGIVLSSSNNNNLSFNFGQGTSGRGILISGSSRNLFLNNTGISGSGRIVELASGANHNRILNTTGSTATTAGVLVSGSSNNTLGSNTFASGGTITSSQNNTLFDNTWTSTVALSVGSLNNSFNREEINSTGQTLAISASSNNTFTDIILRAVGTWISTDSTSLSNNFTNTTFENRNGSIRIIPEVNLSPSQAVNQARLNISTEQAFLNSTNLTYFNTSAQITLNNVATATPFPFVDFNDDGVFDPCPTTVCTPVSFIGNIFIFNVTHFTTFQLQTGAVNVTLVKTDTPDPVFAGSQLNYTIQINVSGTAVDLNFTDTFPAEITFLNASPPANISNSTWLFGNVTDQNLSINVTTTVNAGTANGTLLNNTANVTFGNVTDSNFSLQVVENTTVLAGVVALTLTKTDSPDPVLAGASLSYSIAINVSGDTAVNVTLFDTLPNNVSFASAQPTPDSGTNSTFSLGNVSNTTIVVNITTTVQSNITNGTNLINFANITFSDSSQNNFSTTDQENTTGLLANPAVTLTKTDSPDPVVPGTQLNYTVTVSVTSGTALNVTLTDFFPQNVTFNGSVPNATSGNNVFFLGNLTSGESIEINISVIVDNVTSGTVLPNNASVEFFNATGIVRVLNTSIDTTAQTAAPAPAPAVGGGGGGGGAGRAAAGLPLANCPDICQAYPGLPECRNCPQVAPVQLPTSPIPLPLFQQAIQNEQVRVERQVFEREGPVAVERVDPPAVVRKETAQPEVTGIIKHWPYAAGIAGLLVLALLISIMPKRKPRAPKQDTKKTPPKIQLVKQKVEKPRVKRQWSWFKPKPRTLEELERDLQKVEQRLKK